MQNFPEIEKKILKFWKENKVFEKSLKKTKNGKNFVFYDGPITVNAKPGIHHVLARIFKDIIPRFKTMQGYYVQRKNGWDTHGLPVELEVEKKLKLESKKQIQEYGIAEFNKQCRKSIDDYLPFFQDLTERIAYWVDMDNSYITYKNEYIETVWQIIKQISDKGLLEQNYKVVPYCSRCGTGLSSHEVAQGYRKIKEPAIYVKFELEKGFKFQVSGFKTYFLVWTTTPWTLPGNVAIAVNPDITYLLVVSEGGPTPLSSAGGRIPRRNECFIIAKERKEVLGQGFEVLKEIKGKELVGLSYESVFDKEELDLSVWRSQTPPSLAVSGTARQKEIYKVLPADFVNTNEGTGLVHIAPAFGQDDMELIKAQNAKCKVQNKEEYLEAQNAKCKVQNKEEYLEAQNAKRKAQSKEEYLEAQNKNNEFPILLTVDEQGKFKDEVKKWAGMFVKKADPLIIEYLREKQRLFKEEQYEHDYPFCWRCKSPLLYYAKKSWFIKMSALREKLLEKNKQINWVPSHLKQGRFGEWLREVKDWNLSRERYWGTPLPIWKCEKCNNIKIIGSVEELEKMSGKTVKDLHRPYIDEIEFCCSNCKGIMKRVPEVIDCWFDSGAMPFAQGHWPFNDKLSVVKNHLVTPELFPADYISEAIDQTRGWFYTLLAISTLLGFESPYKNVLCLGLIVDAKGEKMSKSKGNIVEPWEEIEKYGADALRWYFFIINNPGDIKKYDSQQVQVHWQRMGLTLLNCLKFFNICAKGEKFNPYLINSEIQTKTLLDKWIISLVNKTIKEVGDDLEKFKIDKGARKIEYLIDNLSNWYLRRSRKRFQSSENNQSLEYYYSALFNITLLIAPFTPFLSEMIFQELNKFSKEKLAESVHLMDWPKFQQNNIDEQLEKKMDGVRKITALALKARQEAGIKVRQPLKQLTINNKQLTTNKGLLDLIKEEVNIKEIIFDSKIKKEIELDTKITAELKEEGMIREVVREIQGMRKKAGLKPKDKIMVKYSGSDKQVFEKNQEIISEQANIKKLVLSEQEEKLITIKKI